MAGNGHKIAIYHSLSFPNSLYLLTYTLKEYISQEFSEGLSCKYLNKILSATITSITMGKIILTNVLVFGISAHQIISTIFQCFFVRSFVCIKNVLRTRLCSIILGMCFSRTDFTFRHEPSSLDVQRCSRAPPGIWQIS